MAGIIIDLTLFSIAVAIGFITSVLAPITSRPFVSAAKARGSKEVAATEPQNDRHGAAAA